jgi:hypothetical protein
MNTTGTTDYPFELPPESLCTIQPAVVMCVRSCRSNSALYVSLLLHTEDNSKKVIEYHIVHKTPLFLIHATYFPPGDSVQFQHL